MKLIDDDGNVIYVGDMSETGWGAFVREKKENQRLRELLDFLLPELCVDCYQIYYDYEHPEEWEVSDDT